MFSDEVFEAVIPLVMDNAAVKEPAVLSIVRGLLGVVCFHRVRSVTLLRAGYTSDVPPGTSSSAVFLRC